MIADAVLDADADAQSKCCQCLRFGNALFLHDSTPYLLYGGIRTFEPSSCTASAPHRLVHLRPKVRHSAQPHNPERQSPGGVPTKVVHAPGCAECERRFGSPTLKPTSCPVQLPRLSGFVWPTRTRSKRWGSDPRFWVFTTSTPYPFFTPFSDTVHPRSAS